MKTARKPARPRGAAPERTDGAARTSRSRGGRGDARRPHESRAQGPLKRQGPQSAPTARPAERPARAKTTVQAKARAKARKAKAPKVIRPPLRERIAERVHARLAGLDLRPQALLARIPFVVLVMGALASGLAITLWLSTASAQRSYQLGSARALNEALTQQKEALERDVLQAESAPALADAARNLGMIPSRDTAHLVQDPAGNWVVVGKPKPAEGAPPPPMNSKLPDEKPPAAPAPLAAPMPKPGAAPEVPKRVGPLPAGARSTEVPVVLPPAPGTPHAGGGLQLVPLPGPSADTLAGTPPALVAPSAPTVAAVPNGADVTGVGAAVPAGVPSQ